MPINQGLESSILSSRTKLTGEFLRNSVVVIGTRGYPSYYGGFETAVRKLVPYLAENGWDVTVYGRPGSTKNDDPLLDSRVKRVVTFGIERKSLSTLTYGLTSVVHALIKKPDVALVMNVANGFWLPLLRARGIPVIVNVDGIEWDRAKWSLVAKGVFRAGAWMTAIFANEIIVDSQEIGRRWKSEFKRDGIFIPYGGDTTPPLPTEMGFEHRGYALVVARFVPENTIPEFFDAATTIASKWPVIVVGSSGYGGEIEEQIRKLVLTASNIHWLGHISDDTRLLSLWQHAGAYFHGHSVGGTNPALVQAMACGAPIIARDTPFNREVLEHAGDYCRPEAPHIAEGVLSLLANPERQEELSEASIRRARHRFSWMDICSSYERALRDLTPKQARR